ncbi:MAG: phosphoglucosamine mutase, partial [Pseudomonadota bacterium]
LLEEVRLFPQVLLNVRLTPGQDWKSSSKLAEATREVEAELAGKGRLLVRASGTEPLLRIMVEAADAAQARACAERLVAAVQAG